MTDKQIIIDGIDVSKCCWCDFEPDTEPYCRINDGEDLGCEENSNCYFKQLKRKEQRIVDLNKMVEAKEQECEELKQWKKGAESLFKAQIDNTDKIINQYKQALDEIKEIAEEQVPYLNIGEAKTMIEIEYDYAGAICNLEQRMDKILQKISKCEEVITKT